MPNDTTPRRATGRARRRPRTRLRSWGPKTAGNTTKKAKSPYRVWRARLSPSGDGVTGVSGRPRLDTPMNATAAIAQLAYGTAGCHSSEGRWSVVASQALSTASSIPKANTSRYPGNQLGMMVARGLWCSSGQIRNPKLTATRVSRPRSSARSWRWRGRWGTRGARS